VGVELSIECMGSAFLVFQERKRKMIIPNIFSKIVLENRK